MAYKHTLPSMKSWVPILTTVHPIALAEFRQRVWFSFLSHGLSNLLVLIALSSIVPGTATLISLLQDKKQKRKKRKKNNYHQILTFPQTAKSRINQKF